MKDKNIEQENTMVSSQSSDLGTEKIGKLLARFAIPCIISLLVNSLYNIVDQIFIGWGVGYLGTGATNVAFPFVTLSLAVALLVGDGCAANISLKLGANDKRNAEKGFANSLLMLLFFSILFIIIGKVFLEKLLLAFGATTEVLPYAIDYTNIILLGLPFMIITTGLNSTIRADGSPKYAMLSMLVGAVINTILDPIFIFTFDMGVAGAAIATIIGQIVSFIISFLYLFKMKSLTFRWYDMHPDFSVMLNIAALGASSFITQFAICFVQVAMNNTLTHYGALSVYGANIPLSALGIVMKVNQILISIILGISVGSQPIIGFNYGARNFGRVRKIYRAAVWTATVVAVFGFFLFQVFPKQIIGIFGEENQLYNEFAVKCFRIYLLLVGTAGFQIVSSVYFQAVGKPTVSIILSLSRQMLFQVPMILLLPRFFGLDGALYAGPVADMTAFILSVFFIWREFHHYGENQAGMLLQNATD